MLRLAHFPKAAVRHQLETLEAAGPSLQIVRDSLAQGDMKQQEPCPSLVRGQNAAAGAQGMEAGARGRRPGSREPSMEGTGASPPGRASLPANDAGAPASHQKK